MLLNKKNKNKKFKKQKVHTPTSTAVRLVENEDEAIIKTETTSTEAVASPSDETGKHTE